MGLICGVSADLCCFIWEKARDTNIGDTDSQSADLEVKMEFTHVYILHVKNFSQNVNFKIPEILSKAVLYRSSLRI